MEDCRVSRLAFALHKPDASMKFTALNVSFLATFFPQHQFDHLYLEDSKP